MSDDSPSIFKFSLLVIVVLVLCFRLMSYVYDSQCASAKEDTIKYYQEKAKKQLEALELVAPYMNNLAKDGKPDAIIWMVKAQHQNGLKNYPSYEKQFEQLLEQKNADALFLKATLTYPTNLRAGLQYAEKASNEGSLDAYIFLLEKQQIVPTYKQDL